MNPGWYETRNGKRTFILGKLPEEIDSKYPIVGFIKTGDDWIQTNWCANGNSYLDGTKSDLDLVNGKNKGRFLQGAGTLLLQRGEELFIFKDGSLHTCEPVSLDDIITMLLELSK